jgi:hypothetical protein
VLLVCWVAAELCTGCVKSGRLCAQLCDKPGFRGAGGSDAMAPVIIIFSV